MRHPLSLSCTLRSVRRERLSERLDQRNHHKLLKVCITQMRGIISGIILAPKLVSRQIFATLLKWSLAEISAIAKFARNKANFHWILRMLENITLPAEIFASQIFIRKCRKNLDLAHITRCTV